jgi:hypothetical protein
MTKLNKPLARSTATEYQRRAIIISIAPCGASGETLVSLRLKGARTHYKVALSRLYVEMAIWHADKERAAKKQARKLGIPWKQAKKQFNRDNQ